MALRERLKEDFEKKHGARLGFMSFFVKACIAGAQGAARGQCRDRGRRPRLQELLRHRRRRRHAAGPGRAGAARCRHAVVRRDREGASASSAARRATASSRIADLTGGTFTISNGGVYGSLMSTPILNPPQSAILGMHKIQQRPMVVGGEIKVRPMMYLARLLRPPHHRRPRGRAVPGARQGMHRGSRAAAARRLSDDHPDRSEAEWRTFHVAQKNRLLELARVTET